MNDKNEDEGFLALLKPIQDLTRNWEVDLSLHLDEYIAYIRQLCGDDIPDMNFAQAAVLLQNSANIYSKKVDFLFHTVIQLFDTLSKNQASKTKDGEAEEGGANGPVKARNKVAVLDTEEFAPLDDVCSDRSLTIDLVKVKQKAAEVKKPKIVLNAAIKVKAKEKTSNNIYNYKDELMGKKEEFRLNWRICSAGTLHQEFIISKNRFRSMEPVEISIAVPEASRHSFSPGNGGDDWQGDEAVAGGDDAGLAPSSPNPLLANSVLSTIPAGPDRESELMRLAQGARKPADNIVEIKAIEWQENDFSHQIPEKPIKKRKVTKLPDQLAEEKKRKQGAMSSFSIIDVFFVNYKNTSFNRALDFSYESKHANIYRRQLLLDFRNKYQDFRGFPDGESDNENDFEGFPELNNSGDTPALDVSLSDKNNDVINEDAVGGGWRGDDPSSYHNEAMRTMQAYRSRKIDHNRMTDMARRVDEWHQKILPKLENAEERSGFDVHEYGSKILDFFEGEIGSVKRFEEIVGGQPREEVARYFLSVLMLANQYNLEITETESGDLNTDCVLLKLLSTVRHHEELDDNLRHTSEKS